MELTGEDVVRHALVKRVIQAFEQEESRGYEGGMGPSIGAVPAKKWHKEEPSEDAGQERGQTDGDDDIAPPTT